MVFLKKKDLIYPDLSYLILNCVFKIHNTLGGGLSEKDYQNALASEFKSRKVLFEEQHYLPLDYCGIHIRKRFCDFLIEDKIIIEIKSGTRIKYKDFKQTEEYLKVKNCKLGLQIVFGREYVTFKRVLNLGEETNNV